MLKAKHQQLFDILKEEFLRGEWPCGEKLPRLTVLAEKYSVSINIASKAVDLLKNAGMVEAKVGDGIYSTFKVPVSINSLHYAGDRVYGYYRGAKRLRILVEDREVYQCAFWNRFFQDFSSENPDIEIDVNFYSWDVREGNTPYEAVIGGTAFLRKRIQRGEKGLPINWVRSFVPDLYQNCIYGLADFPGVLPYGFSCPELLAIRGTPVPEPQENFLDYLERLPDSMLGYLVCSSRQLLACMGIDMTRIGTDLFSSADAEAMLSVFQRAKKMYDAGRLLWPHGKITDKERMYELLRNRQIQAMEIQSNVSRCFPDDPQIQTLPYPHGEKPCVTTHFVYISENTLYPEEYLRVVKALVSREVQQRGESERLFYSIRKDVPSAESETLREAIQAGGVQMPGDDADIQSEAFFNFLGWEFYYYLEGRRGPEVIELINRKIRYYYEHINQTEENGK